MNRIERLIEWQSNDPTMGLALRQSSALTVMRKLAGRGHAASARQFYGVALGIAVAEDLRPARQQGVLSTSEVHEAARLEGLLR